MLDLFASTALKEKWEEWTAYRKDRKLAKYAMNGKYVLKRLLTLSQGNEQKAIEMIDQAMENNWQGFGFEQEKQLKKNAAGNNQGSQQPSGNQTGTGRIDALREW